MFMGSLKVAAADHHFVLASWSLSMQGLLPLVILRCHMNTDVPFLCSPPPAEFHVFSLFKLSYIVTSALTLCTALNILCISVVILGHLVLQPNLKASITLLHLIFCTTSSLDSSSTSNSAVQQDAWAVVFQKQPENSLLKVLILEFKSYFLINFYTPSSSPSEKWRL